MLQCMIKELDPTKLSSEEMNTTVRNLVKLVLHLSICRGKQMLGVYVHEDFKELTSVIQRTIFKMDLLDIMLDMSFY